MALKIMSVPPIIKVMTSHSMRCVTKPEMLLRLVEMLSMILLFSEVLRRAKYGVKRSCERKVLSSSKYVGLLTWMLMLAGRGFSRLYFSKAVERSGCVSFNFSRASSFEM